MATSAPETYGAIVIGGGFFGVETAVLLKERTGKKILLLEKAPDILTRASYSNQARVHGGYHYPRSVLTAQRSRVNHPRFLADYKDAVLPGFQGHYAVAREQSHVTADQFKSFMRRVGAPLVDSPAEVRGLFNDDLIDGVWTVEESVFNAAKLRAILKNKLMSSGVKTELKSTARKVVGLGSSLILDYTDSSGESRQAVAPHVFNCTYSNLNGLLHNSDLPIIPLKHELTEMALVKAPKSLDNTGITVMCGPFFSLMPFPDLNCHTLSHVRYTPHHEWHDEVSQNLDPDDHLKSYGFKTQLEHMIRDASRFMPALADCQPVGESIWEVKTVLPKSEEDDSRPILFRENHGLQGLHCVLGGKIDNVYDILDAVGNMDL